MSDDETTNPNGLTIIPLESLAILERRREAIAAAGDKRVATTNELLVYEFLITKLRSDADLHEQLAKMMQRIDDLERSKHVDSAMVDALVADARETRRLTIVAHERIDVLASTVNAALDEMARVSDRSELLAKRLVGEAERKTGEHPALALELTREE